MPPGPKNKGGCPSDLHLKLPDDIRHLVDDLGPGRYQDKIIDSIRRCARKKPPKSTIELQMEIFGLKKEHRIITERLKILWDDLEVSYNLSESDLETIQQKLQSDVDQWYNSIK